VKGLGSRFFLKGAAERGVNLDRDVVQFGHAALIVRSIV
jgi:hypothetical protein